MKSLAGLRPATYAQNIGCVVPGLRPLTSNVLELRAPFVVFCFSPPDRKGSLDCMLESAFAVLLHHAPTQYPARAARQWIPPSAPPAELASGSRRVSRQRRSIPPKRLASGSRRVSRQRSLPVDPAEYPARASCQWIPPSIPPEQLASGSRRVSS